MRRIAATVVAVASISILGATLTAPAYADDSSSGEVAAVLAEVTGGSSSPATDVLDNVAAVPTDELGEAAIQSTVNGVDITVPTDASRPLELEAPSGDVIAIELPFSGDASPAEVVTAGVVSYDNNNSSVTAPIVKADGSLQVTTIIQGPNAPTSYDYNLSMPTGARPVLGEDGNVTIVSSEGVFIAGVTPAWAKDANGLSVPTHYALNGNTLTQVVDHANGSFAYPVVADPWMGSALVQRTAWVGNTLQVYPTDWARISYTNIFKFSAGWGARWAGWDEVLSKTPGNRENTASMRDQYYCHFDFVRFRAPNKPSWNLDLYRRYVDYGTLVRNECNV